MSKGALRLASRVWLRPELIASWVQIAATVFLMLGSGIIFGLIYGQTHRSGDFISMMMNDKFLVRNGTVEAPLLGLFFLVLRRRGWTRTDLRIRIGWSASLDGLKLLVLTYVSLLCVMLPLIVLSWPDSSLGHWARSIVPHTMMQVHRGSVHLSWTVIIACTVLNAFYEEIVYMGYFFNQCAAKRGPWTAVIATVLLRLAVHTYQGTEHILQIGVWSVVFGLWYRWSGKVWPLILAHSAIDVLSLGALKILFGNGT